jgi:hypothetical protein
MATRARCASAGSRCSSSKTMTKALPGRRAGSRFEDERGAGTAAGGAAPAGGAGGEVGSGRSTASKVTICWGTPSSVTVKSFAWSPGTGRPSLPVTTTSTVTTSVREGNVGGGCS